MSFTFCMIKPDAVAKGRTGAILHHLEKENFFLVKARLMTLTPAFCEIFYQEHKEKIFFNSLVEFITSGPVLALALKRENAFEKLRQVMGATNPKEAEANSVRALWGESVERNAIHGSDSSLSAQRELSLFFPEVLF